MGIWACDAGKVSGIASCVMDMGLRGPERRRVRLAEHKDSWQLGWENVKPTPWGPELDDRSAAVIGAHLASKFMIWKGAMNSYGVHWHLLVLEQFRLRASTGVGSMTVEVTLPMAVNAAMLGFLGGRVPYDRVEYVSPSDGMGVVTDERLRALGLWKKGEGHSRDAWRYLLVAARRRADEGWARGREA